MEIKPIKTENDYNKALQRLELIFDAHPNSKQGDEAEIGSRNRLAENHTSVDKQVSPQCQAGGGEG